MRRWVEAAQVTHLAVTLRAAVVVGRLGAADVQFRLAERTVHFRLGGLWRGCRGGGGLLLLGRFMHLLVFLSLGPFLLVHR